jgi:hypothetical protein
MSHVAEVGRMSARTTLQMSDRLAQNSTFFIRAASRLGIQMRFQSAHAHVDTRTQTQTDT